MPSLRAAIDEALRGFPALLARLGVVDRRMGEEAFRLATPVIVTGGLRILLRLADFVMVGIFLLRLPVAFLGLPAAYAVTIAGLSVTPGLGLGLAAVFVAILVDLYTKGAVNTWRFASGRWQAIAARSEVGATPTE